MKQFTGLVVAAKQPLTVTVKIDTLKRHPLYKKRVKKSRKYLVHDPVGVAVNDTVIFKETKPISRRKHWQIVKKI